MRLHCFGSLALSRIPFALLLSLVGPMGHVSQARAVADGTWTELSPPGQRLYFSSVYDPVRNRLLIVDGFEEMKHSCVWELSLTGTPQWRRLVTTGTQPLPRFGHSVIYDAANDRLVMFGGYTVFDAVNEVWSLSLTGTPSWTQLTPGGTPPVRRQNHRAIYDPVRHRMLVFGGFTTSPVTYLNDVWALSLDGTPTWSSIVTSGTPPAPRVPGAWVYDSAHDQLALFGGSSTTNFNDAWTLSLDASQTWIELSPSGPIPAARGTTHGDYDAGGHRLVIFGGSGSGGSLKDAWALSLDGLPAWTELTPPSGGPAASYAHTTVYDPIQQRLLVVGGSGQLGEVSSLSLTGSPQWSLVVPAGAPRRSGHTGIYDPVRDRMWIIGGVVGSSYVNEVWYFDLAEQSGWTHVTTAGLPPSPRWQHTAIYDRRADRIVVYGGRDGSGALGDAWALSLADPPTWNPLTPLGTPPTARYGHTAIYDPARDRMVVFGGSGTVTNNEVWELSLLGTPAWSPIATSGTPPDPRDEICAILDPVRDRMVIQGGIFPDNRSHQIWALSFSGTPTWTQLPPGFENMRHAALYDPIRDRMVNYGGGLTDAPGFNGVIAFSFASNQWSHLAPAGETPLPYDDLAAVYDAGRDRMVVFGGSGYIRALSWGATVDVPVSAASSRLQLAASPNPAVESVEFTMTLTSAGNAKLEIFDLAGRRVRTLVDGRLTSGPHTVRWNRRGASGAAVPAGVYVVSLHVDGELTTRRVAVLD